MLFFGLLAVFELPIQLTPDIERPTITVTTTWLGASPVEVESEVIEPQETRPLWVADRQIVLSPPWSIHMGSGTRNYTFIWAMAGDNVDYTDVDPVSIEELR